jgi:uracil-DNA glycosylase
MNEKIEQYYALVEKAKKLYQKHEQVVNAVRLRWCDACKEIILWTYWQGRNHIDSAKLMLVGQDWGCPEEDEGTVQNALAMNQGHAVRYLNNTKICPTDRSLIELFDSIGYQDIAKIDYPELFFTNLILGYRSHNCSGNFKAAWVNECKALFKELVQIIQPEVILCLGRNTAVGTLKALESAVPALLEADGKFHTFIESNENPINVRYGADKAVYLFSLAHCGQMGTLNRNKREGGKTNSGLDRQKGDWKRVLDYYRPQYNK